MTDEYSQQNLHQQSLTKILQSATKEINNGNGHAPEQRPGQAVEAPAADGAATVLRYVEALSDRVMTAGAYARDHGNYVEQISAALADRLDHLCREYARKVLDAERRKLLQLEAILGKLEEPRDR